MARFLISGGTPLHGAIRIGGAKNAALPLLAAGLLTAERLVLSNVPRIDDIATMTELLSRHGLAVDAQGKDGDTLSLGGEITCTEAPYEIVSKMRASILVLGPVLARCGIIVNVTPLEPEWEGQVTIEISNTTPLPARIYADEGICQFLFLQGAGPCEISYADKAGKYRGQRGGATPRM